MRTMEYNILSLDQITASQGRELDTKTVESIADSIRLCGLLNPISVHAEDDGNFRIISGRHRLAAVRLLGMSQIDVQIYRGLSEIDLRLAEIIENLHRAELTVQQRSDQIAEYAELVKKKRQQGAAQLGHHLSNAKGASGREGGDSAAARDLGIDRKELQRAEKIANIDPEAKAAAVAAGFGDNQSALLKISAAPKEQQKDFVAELTLKKAKKPKKPKKPKIDQRDGKDVNETVKAILRDFSASDVQLIIAALTEGLAQRAIGVTPETPAQRAGADQGAIAACPVALADTDPSVELNVDWEELSRINEKYECEERARNFVPDPVWEKKMEELEKELGELVLNPPPSAVPDADDHGFQSAKAA